MNKRFISSVLAASFFLVFLSYPARADHEALASLLGNGQLALKSQPLCEPYQTDSQQSAAASILSKDIALALSDMENRPVSIDSKCEGSGASRQCTVIFAVHQGELEWARVYQFTSTHASTSSGKTPSLANLKCFNLP